MEFVNLTQCKNPLPVIYSRREREKSLMNIRAERSELRKALLLKKIPAGVYKRKRKYLKRREREVSHVPHNFGIPTYFVGCGKCEECAREKQVRKVTKWTTRISSMIEYFRRHRLFLRCLASCASRVLEL